MHYFTNIGATIGSTPLVRLNRLAEGLEATIFAKLEFFNPLGSVKDRIAVAMIAAAETQGLITARAPSSSSRPAATPGSRWRSSVPPGDTASCLTMPDTMSIERRQTAQTPRRAAGAHPGRRRHEGRHRESRGNRGGGKGGLHAASSSTIRPTRASTAKPRPRKSGTTPRARWIFWWPAWAPVARLPACSQALKPRKPHFQDGGRRTDRLTGAFRGQNGPAQDPGHRRRLHPAGSGPVAARRGRSR